MDAVRQLILQRVEELRLDLANLSRGIKRNHAYLHQFINRGTPVRLAEQERERLAPLLGLAPDMLKTEEAARALLGRDTGRPAARASGLAHPQQEFVDENKTRIQSPHPEEHLPAEPESNVRVIEMPARLDPHRSKPVPLLGMAQGGSDGSFILNLGEPILHVERPIGLAGRDRIYALRVENNSMYPAHEDGDIIFVDPGRKPYPGRDAVIELQPTAEHETPRALLKRIVKINGEFVVLKEFQPKERDFRIARDKIRSLHLVLRNHEMY